MAGQKKGISTKNLGYLAVLVILLVLLAAKAVWNLGTCHLYGFQTDRTVKYAIGVGCLVKKDSGWTPKAELRTEQ